jgi:hypothetical protein
MKSGRQWLQRRIAAWNGNAGTLAGPAHGRPASADDGEHRGHCDVGHDPSRLAQASESLRDVVGAPLDYRRELSRSRPH